MTSEPNNHLDNAVDEYISETGKYKNMLKLHVDKYGKIQARCVEINALSETITKDKEEAVQLGKRLLQLVNKIHINDMSLYSGRDEYIASIGTFNINQDELLRLSTDIQVRFPKFITTFETNYKYDFVRDFNALSTEIDNKKKIMNNPKSVVPKPITKSESKEAKHTKCTKAVNVKIEKKELPKASVKKALKYDNYFK